MLIETLKKVGLTDNEIAIYLALLELGPSATGAITKKSGLHSSRVYECLEKLQAKGIVAYAIKANRKYFEATDPKRLIDYLDERQRQIEREKTEVRAILPELSAKQKVTKSVQEATIYSSFKGIRALLENLLDELKEGGEYYVFGASGGMKEVVGPYMQVYQKKKAKYRIKTKVIASEKIRESPILKEFFGEARFISDEFISPTDTFIYNDKVIIFIWQEKPPFAVLIRNKSVAQSYKNYFKFLWQKASR